MKKTLITILSIASVSSFAGSNVIVGFSGGNSDSNTAISVVLEAINNSQTSIDVLAYSFSNQSIATALIKAQKRGVFVRIIGDYSQNSKGYSQLMRVNNAGIQVKTNNNYQDFHNKVMIVDSSCVETGSFNYSASAENKNAENALYICDRSLAAQYQSQFNTWWNASNENNFTNQKQGYQQGNQGYRTTERNNQIGDI